jgi:amino acid adenylation domain-containing protein
MESVTALLTDLRKNDVRIWLDSGKLRVSAPKGHLGPELQRQLTERKAEIISFLEARSRQKAAVPELRRYPRDGVLPLSFAQERLWFLHQFDPASASYNIIFYLSLPGSIDVAAVELALSEIVSRHETLRTTFALADGQPIAVVHPAAPMTLRVVDLSELSVTEREREALRLRKDDANTGFDLSTGPLFRGTLLRLGPNRSDLLLVQHHIISDGWSMALLVDELRVLLRAYGAGQPAVLPELPIQYVDYARWQREWLGGPALDDALGYWKKQLGGRLPILELPTDRPRPPIQTFNGAQQMFRLPKRLTDALNAFCRHENATQFMVLLAAYKLLLSRYSNQRDILVGTTNGSRGRVETEKLIGFFINTLVLRTDLSGDLTFRQLVGRVKTVVFDALAHQDMPFEKLVEALQPERDLSHSPLFQAFFILQNSPLGDMSKAEAEHLERVRQTEQESTASNTPVFDTQVVSSGSGQRVVIETGTAKFDLTLFAFDSGNGLAGNIEYNTDLFDHATITRILDHFETLVQALIDAPDEPVARIVALPRGERRLLKSFNDTARDYPHDRCLHELVSAQAASRSAAVAVSSAGETLTYTELDRRSTQLAHTLREAGVGPGTLVGVAVERSVRMPVALLGILKAGGAYVPLDPAFPPDRLAYMVADAKVSVLLTERASAADLPAGDACVLCIDDPATFEHQPATALPAIAGPDDLAYVIYTSGSTGRPKGVQIPHRAIVNFLVTMAEKPGFTRDDVLVSVTTLSFDIAGLELYLPLLTGGRVVIATRAEAADGPRLAALLDASGATVLQATPATWRLLIEAGWPGRPELRMFCGGEPLPADLAEALGGRGRELWNLYGPTETTVWSTVAPVVTGEPITIGQPIANTDVHVLSADLQPVPLGAIGELYIGGDGLARGYLARPDLTAERFIPHPFSDQIGARLYRTGDLARYLADGRIQCLGRVDHQIKLRGFRIELGEIEAALTAHPAVRSAVAHVHEDPRGDRRLVGYIIPIDGQRPTVSDLRAKLKETLPEYMVPSLFEFLTAFPLTPNGKVDRKALPAPAGARPDGAADCVLPRNEVEQQIAGVWQAVLGLERIGVKDNFFELGGHSLMMVRVQSRLQQIFNRDISIVDMFRLPTIEAFAELMTRDAATRRAIPALRPYPRGERPPLSFAQERLWFLHQFDPQSPSYNVIFDLSLSGEIGVRVVEQALAEIVRRHETLRTTFSAVDGHPAVTVQPPAPVAVAYLDLSAMSPGERDRAAIERRKQDAAAPFDLAAGPLVRATLFRLTRDQFNLLVVQHHIVSDAWSMAVFAEEFAALLKAFAAGKPSPLPDLPIQYVDYAQWQREWLSGSALDAALGYWKKQLGGRLPILELPTDRPRPPVQTFNGAQQSFALSKRVTEALDTLCREESATRFMAVLAAYKLLLSRYTGQHDLAVGTTTANRTAPALEQLIGFFINTVVLRTDLSGELTFRQLVGRVKAVVLDALSNQDVPFEKLVEAVQPERDLSRSPLFQAFFILHNSPLEQASKAAAQRHDARRSEHVVAPTDIWASRALPAGRRLLETGTAKFDLTLQAIDTADGLAGSLEYNTDLFEHATVTRMLDYFESLVQAVADAPDEPLARVSALPAGERRVLEAFNDTARDYPRDRCLHELIAAQAAERGLSIAVACAGETLTYAELDRRSTQLAHALRAAGIGPGRLVGVGVDRTVRMPVALLGILKAGGAYVPLDPAFPPDRLAYMVADARVSVLVTERAYIDHVPAGDARVLCIDDAATYDSYPTTPVPALVGPDDLAYVIYTSGSTGRPKGVEIPHRGIVNFLAAMAVSPGLSADDVVVSVTTLSFDIAGLELYLPLITGGRVVIATRAEAGDGMRLAALLEDSGATVLQATPATWRMLIEAGWPGRPDLRMFCGGEPLPADLADALGGRGGELWNLYGPTETTVWSTVAPVIEGEPITIGRPIANTDVYLLSPGLERVPLGAVGELYIGGDGLARGYLARPELTAERFIPHPFSDQSGARLYRTGDLARYLPDGRIQCLGRVDHQIKLRGFRIELGEIEAALTAHPAVRSAVVHVHEDAGGDRRLVGYVINGDGPRPSVPELRAKLKETLPEYMVPSLFEFLTAFPLTPNGKVDRKALPAPAGARPDAADCVLPRNAVEQQIAGVWQSVLGVERTGVKDNFFDLGGHSLMMVRVQSRLQQLFNREISIVDLFRLPTIEALADHLTRAAAAPVSFRDAQERVAQRRAAARPKARPQLSNVP